MVASRLKVDKPFLIISITLMVVGFFIFNSASLALLAKESSNYSSIAFSQTVFGLFLGTVAMITVSRLDFKILVLVPEIGFEHAGARRWIVLCGLSFQTSEILKLAFILYFAAWASGVKEKMKTFRWGLLPLLFLLAVSALLLSNQPDTDNLILIVLAGTAMFIAAGDR